MAAADGVFHFMPQKKEFAVYEDTQEKINVEVGDLVDVSSVTRFRCIVEEIDDDGSVQSGLARF